MSNRNTLRKKFSQEYGRPWPGGARACRGRGGDDKKAKPVRLQWMIIRLAHFLTIRNLSFLPSGTRSDTTEVNSAFNE